MKHIDQFIYYHILWGFIVQELFFRRKNTKELIFFCKRPTYECFLETFFKHIKIKNLREYRLKIRIRF